MNYDRILSMKPSNLLDWLINEFDTEIPAEIKSIDDMSDASDLLLHLTSNYSYLITLLSYSKLCVREAKRSGNKEYHEDAIDRRDIIQAYVDIVKQQYTAVSRAVTIKVENNKEILMSEGYRNTPYSTDLMLRRKNA